MSDDDAMVYLDIEIGLKSGGSQELTLQDGRDSLGQDKDTGALEAIVRHSDDRQEKLVIAADNIAFTRTTKRIERPERRAEGEVLLTGVTPTAFG